MNVGGASSAFGAVHPTTSSSLRSPTERTASSSSGSPHPRIGSGRAPQLRGLHALLALSMTAKMGFREVSAADLPDKAREELSRKVAARGAVSYWTHPGTGEIRVVVQNEDNRDQVNVYSWRNNAWTTLL